MRARSRQTDRAGDPAVLDPCRAVEASDDQLQLEAHQDEREDVQHEDSDFPHRVRRDADTRRNHVRRDARRRHREHHHGQDAGEMQPFGEQPDAERAAELHDHRRGDVFDVPVDVEDDARERESENDAADRHDQQHRDHAPAGEKPDRYRADRQPIDQQRARVVEEALPFQDHEQAMRRPELLQHRRRRRGIRRGDDRTERDRGRPRHLGDERTHDHGHNRDRQHDRAESQARHRTPVRAEIARRGVECGVEQHRRHEQRQRELRIEHQRRYARDERERRASHRHQRRIRRSHVPRQRRQASSAEEQRDHDLEDFHSTSKTAVILSRVDGEGPPPLSDACAVGRDPSPSRRGSG
jgi:hypothetical protein